MDSCKSSAHPVSAAPEFAFADYRAELICISAAQELLSGSPPRTYDRPVADDQSPYDPENGEGDDWESDVRKNMVDKAGSFREKMYPSCGNVKVHSSQWDAYAWHSDATQDSLMVRSQDALKAGSAVPRCCDDQRVEDPPAFGTLHQVESQETAHFDDFFVFPAHCQLQQLPAKFKTRAEGLPHSACVVQPARQLPEKGMTERDVDVALPCKRKSSWLDTLINGAMKQDGLLLVCTRVNLHDGLSYSIFS